MPYAYDRPESMLGEILALEGIRDSVTIVHGPTGCKYYPSSCSEGCFRTRDEGGADVFNPFIFRPKCYFGQPRLPCTYLDGNDYVSGASDKLEDVFLQVKGSNAKVIGIINSPGSSMIGERLSHLKADVPVVTIESPECSKPMHVGFSEAICSVIDAFRPIPNRKRMCVNLVGISIWHLGWEDTVSDLTGLLNASGIEVNCVIGAGWSSEDIRKCADASLNAVIVPEFGSIVAEKMLSEYGIPYVIPKKGLIGFDGLDEWVTEICNSLEADPSPSLKKIDDMRMRSARVLKGLEMTGKLPRGRTFSVYADASVALWVSEFLYGYLGMIPAAIGSDTGEEDQSIIGFLDDIGIGTYGDVYHTPCDVMISNGNMIASAYFRRIIEGGYEIASPSSKPDSIGERPVLGLGGTIRLIDSILEILY